MLNAQLIQLIKDELNIKEVVWNKGDELAVTLDIKLDPELEAEGKMRELVRQVQDLRKNSNAKLDQLINLTISETLSEPLLSQLKRQALVKEVKIGNELSLELL